MTDSLAFSTYHSLLRIALCVCAVVLVFDSGLISRATVELSSSAQDYVANAVGVKVGVSANDVNVLTTRITELEKELATKEREINVSVGGTTSSGIDMSTFVLSIILFILLVLIVLNYALDYLRLATQGERPRTSVS